MGSEDWTRSEIGNLEFAETFARVAAEGGSMSDVARELDRTRQAVSERAKAMRARGIELPYFPGELKPSESTDKINQVLAEMEGIQE